MIKPTWTVAVVLLSLSGCAQTNSMTAMPSQLQTTATQTANPMATERQFIDPTFAVTFDHTVVGMLEHPTVDLAHDDTGTKGMDRYRFTVTVPMQRTFRIDRNGTGDHTFRLVDDTGAVVAAVTAQQTAVTSSLRPGTYTLELTHGGQTATHHAVFIHPAYGTFQTAQVPNIITAWNSAMTANLQAMTRLSVGACPHGNFSNADWSGLDLGHVDLHGANLTHAKLVGTKMVGANLRDADLQQVDLTDGTLDKADLTSANFIVTNPGGTTNVYALAAANPTTLVRTSLKGAVLTSAKLSDAVHMGATCRRYRADLTGARLGGATLGYNVRPYAWGDIPITLEPTGLKLAGSQLQNVTLLDKSLKEADLSNADLTGTSLTGVDLTGAVLTGANLTGTGR
jgi:uncharacterized protein YjbI with pentapeptide repeats